MLFMKKLCFLIATFTFSIGISYGEIRDEFHSNDPDQEHLLYVINEAVQSESSIYLGYQGLCQAMMAEHLFLPSSKISSFKKGKLKVEQAIERDPGNCELRYIRLLIQLNAPKFVNYHEEIIGDFKFFVDNIHTQISDDHWKLTFINNLIEGKHLSENQKHQLVTLKKEL